MLFLLGLRLLSFRLGCAAIHSLHGQGLASLGTLYPKNIQYLMVDDFIVYYYNSASKETQIPKWLNHSEGGPLWEELRSTLISNRHVMNSAVRVTSERFNHSHDHIYQVHGRCEWNVGAENYISAGSHAYDGKDFVSFDVKSRTWVAAVPEAVFYKTKRQENMLDVQRLIYHYEIQCIHWLKKLLDFSKKERKEKVPDVKLIENWSTGSYDKVVTCHVTGFYPREVQVEWLDEKGQPLLNRVIPGEVLPNGDGTYQVRQALKIPGETPWSQVYRCVVRHSSVTGNITMIWAFSEPKRTFLILAIPGGLLIVVIVTLIVISCIRKKTSNS